MEPRYDKPISGLRSVGVPTPGISKAFRSLQLVMIVAGNEDFILQGEHKCLHQ